MPRFVIIAAALILGLPATALALPIHVHKAVPVEREVVLHDIVRGDPLVAQAEVQVVGTKVNVIHVAPADDDEDGVATADDPCPQTAGSDGGCPPPEPVYTESTESSYSEPNYTESYAPSGDLSAIAACESGGNYSTNTGNGYSGAYQFDDATWQAAGGSTASAYQASPAEQDAVAAAWIAAGNRSAWPNC